MHLRVVSGCVGIGIVDAQYKVCQNFNKVGEECPNRICYYSHGVILNQNQWKEGHIDMKEGETITVKVDIEKGTVSWAVDGTVLAIVENNLISDQSINWVPYFYMKEKSALAIVG